MISDFDRVNSFNLETRQSRAAGEREFFVDFVEGVGRSNLDPTMRKAKPVKGRITLSGYEGSELLVARLLVESGADLRYVGTACPKTPWSAADCDWLEARGVHVQYRASLEQDLCAMREFKRIWDPLGLMNPGKMLV